MMGFKGRDEGKGMYEDEEGARSKGGVVVSSEVREGVDSRFADGRTRWKRENILSNSRKERPQTAWQMKEMGEKERRMDVFAGFARGIFPWTGCGVDARRSYEANGRRIRVRWRSYTGNRCWLSAERGWAGLVEVAELLTFCCVVEKIKEGCGREDGIGQFLPRTVVDGAIASSGPREIKGCQAGDQESAPAGRGPGGG